MTRQRSSIKPHPSMETSLSTTQREFVCFVELRAGAHDALYQAGLESGLPGDTVWVSMRTTSDAAGGVFEHTHTVEFMSLTGEGRWESAGQIEHVEIERSSELVDAGFRDGEFANGDVERAVQGQLEKLKKARLLPLPARSAPRNRTPRQLACAA
jgi:hypothetical protein